VILKSIQANNSRASKLRVAWVFFVWVDTYSIGWTRWGVSKGSKLRWGYNGRGRGKNIQARERDTQFKSIQASEEDQLKRIQADGETGGSWVVQNDPSQRETHNSKGSKPVRKIS
jgi:hypothetical protein